MDETDAMGERTEVIGTTEDIGRTKVIEKGDKTGPARKTMAITEPVATAETAETFTKGNKHREGATMRPDWLIN